MRSKEPQALIYISHAYPFSPRYFFHMNDVSMIFFATCYEK
jgi:hypothetical protein